MRALLALCAFAVSAPLSAQTIVTSVTSVTSPAAETVTMTVYRDPYRGDGPINANWPGGYALITETRTIAIPAGDSVVRFAGVAEGLFPESAIVTGLPKGVKEKNRDARLISPAGLVDAYLKRKVQITRTEKATGKSKQYDAMITAGPDGGVILETEEGYEAYHCTGLPERMNYSGGVGQLTARPTLSVQTNSDKAQTVNITLSYMASGFDWQANYVLNADKFGESSALDMNVFAWMTIANGGNQSFADAQVMAVAGRLNRRGNAALPAARAPGLSLQCWPRQRTHQVPFRLGYIVDEPEREQYVQDAPIAVTAFSAERLERKSRRNRGDAMMAPAPAPEPVMVAQQEELGDLKLYRIPERVTVNAKGQKQVAMIVQPDAKLRRVYRGQPVFRAYHQPQLQLTPVLIGENDLKKGLGVPLPAGQAQLFEDSVFGFQRVAELRVSDRAVGDKIEWPLAPTIAVQTQTILVETRKKQYMDYRVKVTNANPYAISAELLFPAELATLPEGFRKVDGKPTWFVTVPANDSSEIIVRVKWS
jgi:hypothetical protein